MPTQDRATYTVELVDSASDAATSAADALGRLKAQIDKDTKALSDLQKALKNLKGATNPNTAEIGRLEKALGQVKERLAATQGKFLEMGGTFHRSSGAASDFRTKMLALVASAQSAPGPLGQLAGNMLRFVTSASASRLVLLGLTAGLVGLGAAAVATASKLESYATSVANARRSELLQLEAVTKMRTVYAATYGLARDKAKDLQGAIDEVAASVTISRDRVAQYAIQLEKMGVRGANVKTALRAVSTAASGWTEEVAEQTAQWAASLALTGGNVKKLADRVQNQIGGVVAKKMLDANVQQQKLAESYAALFAGIDINPLLEVQKEFNDLFAQSTESGRALRDFLGAITQPLIDGLAAGTRAFKNFFLDIIIFALEVQGAWLDFRLAIRSAVADAKTQFDAIEATVTQTWQNIAAVISNTWKAIEGVLTKGIDFVKEHMDEFAAIIIGTALKLAVDFAPAAWAATVALYEQASAATAAGLAASKDLAVGLWKAIPALAKAGWEASKNLAVGLWRAIPALLAAGVQAAATGIAFLVGLLPGIWAAVTGFAAMAVGVLAATWPFLAFIAGVWLLIKAWPILVGWFESIDFGQLGIAMIDGVVNGLAKVKDAFVGAIKGLAEVGIKAFTSIFKIGSPSKLFEDFGGDITTGLTMGVEAGAPEAQAAMQSLAPADPAAGVAAGSARGGGGQISIGTINLTVGADADAADAQSIAASIKRELENILASVALQMGAPAP